MFRARPRNARHAAPPRRGRTVGALAAATAVTAATVATGVVATAEDEPGASMQAALGAGTSVQTVDLDRLRESRQPRASRTSQRVLLTPQAIDHEFATTALNVWTLPRERGKRVGQVPRATKLAVTGQVVGHWAEVLVKGDRVRWVNANRLAERKPQPKPEPEPEPEAEPESTSSDSTASSTAGSGLSTAPCPDGSSIESGLTSSAIRLYRAVCAAFPVLSSYGGYDAHGEHIDGRAIDFMISGSTGQAVADWVRANAGALGVRDIIYAQRIWTPEQSSAGWRYMEDRGSTTANHYDHVHVAVF